MVMIMKVSKDHMFWWVHAGNACLIVCFFMTLLYDIDTFYSLFFFSELCGIPDNIKGCKHLAYVDVSVNQLEKLPEGFTQLLSLEELYLNDTCLDFLPANFGRLTKLRILELRENNLNTLPKSIARLTSLERMDIGQNEFSDLVSVIF